MDVLKEWTDIDSEVKVAQKPFAPLPGSIYGIWIFFIF